MGKRAQRLYGKSITAHCREEALGDLRAQLAFLDYIVGTTKREWDTLWFVMQVVLKVYYCASLFGKVKPCVILDLRINYTRGQVIAQLLVKDIVRTDSARPIRGSVSANFWAVAHLVCLPRPALLCPALSTLPT